MTHAPDDDELTPADRDALIWATAEARRDPKEAEHLDRLLKGRTWADVARTASYQCQRKNLGLRPWELPPMYGNVEGGDPKARDKARKLLDRLLACGLSRYEPHPERALAAIERPPAA